MESRKLEIVLHSAKDLHDRKHFGTMDPYATVWFAGGGMISEIHKTTVAKKAGPCPVWECPIEFEVVPKKNDYVLFCEIHHDGKLFDRKIGEVHVPFKDLLAGDGLGEKVSYPVKIQYGEVMGLIVISHRFSSTLDAKKEDNNTGTSGRGKVKSNKKNDKEHTPTKKGKGKKKPGMVKRIVKSVGKKVVTEAVLLVGTAAAFFFLEEDVEVEDEDEYEDEDQDEEEVEEEDEVKEEEEEEEVEDDQYGDE